ncbi:MAG: coproporphyrinogen dehydrogenase HemZ [Oscillospiraceae bacterium]|nr:coproporphyrinogen dehydrogenase HemZ [Oscillospiraceae bacterium]
MELKLLGHDCLYQVEQLQQALFSLDHPGEAISTVERTSDTITFSTRIQVGDKVTYGYRELPVAQESLPIFYKRLRQSYFDAALPHLPEVPAWGALAGVRPTKLSTKHLLEGGMEESADALLKEEYYVTAERRKIAIQCSKASVQAVAATEKQDISLYIGIPFCPTRCSYCSFVSRTVGKKTALLDQYLSCLLQEVEATGRLLKEAGRTVRTLYIGGGTPTTLSAGQLKTLMEAVRQHIDLSRCAEYTVEGGRPDTLSEEKLQTLKSLGADRVSINPQTMIDHVLQACGRPHTAEDVRRVFRQAQEAGFGDINMDLIAGLPEDSFAGFQKSLDELIAMNPSNITVHTLALKKGADLFESRQKLPSREEVAQMLLYSRQQLTQAGYQPYYLYRQKYMSGNYENIGWSRDNRDCLYNIYMMEELHPIVSLGGGGMSKVNLPEGRLERFHNPKFPEQYIEQFDKVLEQKKTLCDLLKTL